MSSPTTQAQHVEISLLSRGKKVYPLTYNLAYLEITDIKLPDLVLHNGSTLPVTPVGVEVIGKIDGRPKVTYLLGADNLADLGEINTRLKQVMLGSDIERFGLKNQLGDYAVDTEHLAGQTEMQPGEYTILLLSQQVRIHYISGARLDAVEVWVSVRQADEEQVVSLDIPLHFRDDQPPYLFPIRGDVLIMNQPLSYTHHRFGHSQEFAFDVTMTTHDETGTHRTSRPSEAPILADFIIYRQPVHSVADGVVVAVVDLFPEEETVLPGPEITKRLQEMHQRLGPKIGLMHAAYGNYIIVRHAEEEYAFYGHLNEHSMRVKVGDQVKAGQIIALVGGTGNSSEPHLHFELIDRPDLLTANGLPIAFVDFDASRTNQFTKKMNAFWASDRLYWHLPAIGE